MFNKKVVENIEQREFDCQINFTDKTVLTVEVSEANSGIEETCLIYKTSTIESKEENLSVTLTGYADNLLDGKDGKTDKFGECWFVVPESWAEQMAQSAGFKTLEDFREHYVFEDVDGWLKIALEQGVLEGAGLGKLPN